MTRAIYLFASVIAAVRQFSAAVAATVVSQNRRFCLEIILPRKRTWKKQGNYIAKKKNMKKQGNYIAKKENMEKRDISKRCRNIVTMLLLEVRRVQRHPKNYFFLFSGYHLPFPFQFVASDPRNML